MAGRPTDYNENILQAAKEYVDYQYSGEGEEDVIPSIAGLALYLGVARSTIYDWASQEEKKEFSDTLERLLAKQENILINKGLKGQINSNITKLALANHHGYADKSEIDQKTEHSLDEKSTDILSKVYGS